VYRRKFLRFKLKHCIGIYMEELNKEAEYLIRLFCIRDDIRNQLSLI